MLTINCWLKCCLECFKSVIGTIIHEDQSHLVTGVTDPWTLMQLWDVLQYCQERHLHIAMLNLNLKKAGISLQLSVPPVPVYNLQWMGVPPLMGWIKALYADVP